MVGCFLLVVSENVGRENGCMPLLGAHMSIAGGLDRAVHRAAEAGCDVVQIFSKNNNQWRARSISEDEAIRFREALTVRKIQHPLVHSSYLINLAAPDKTLWRKSVDAMVVELHRAGRLGIPYVVVHPGAYTSGSLERGVRAVARAIRAIYQSLPDGSPQILLENTAGQGSCLGADLSELSDILGQVPDPDRVGICLDTCHAFAAGYGWTPAAEFRRTVQALKTNVGLDKIRAIHLNDSKRERGSRVDRHEHIGHGLIGPDGFRRLLADRQLGEVPMYLETPKGTADGQDWDVVNLRTLRDMLPARCRANR
jgi:deoxyribonuclease IV